MKLKLALALMALIGLSAYAAPVPAQGPPQPPNPPVYGVTSKTVPLAPAQGPPPPPNPPVSPEDIVPFSTTTLPRYSKPEYVTTFAGNAFPEEANVAQEADQLARQLAETKSDTEREKIKTQLGELLKRQFDSRQKRHGHEIEELEAQVKKLKALVEKRQENRNEIIARRLEQILRESQGLGW